MLATLTIHSHTFVVVWTTLTTCPPPLSLMKVRRLRVQELLRHALAAQRCSVRRRLRGYTGGPAVCPGMPGGQRQAGAQLCRVIIVQHNLN